MGFMSTNIFLTLVPLDYCFGASFRSSNATSGALRGGSGGITGIPQTLASAGTVWSYNRLYRQYQGVIYWLDTVIFLLQVTEALIVFKVIKAEEIPRRSTAPPTTTTATSAQPPSTSSVDRRNESTSALGGRGGGSQSVSAGGRFERIRTEPNGAGSRSGSGPSSTMPPLVNHVSTSGSSPSNPLPENTPRPTAATTTINNNNSNSRDAEDLDDMYPEYYEDEEEERFSTDLDRQPHQQQSQGGPSTLRRSRAAGATSGSGNNHRRRRSETDDSGDSEGSTDDEDPLGDDYEEVLEQETFVFQLRFQDLMAYVFSSQEALTMPDARALTGTSASGGGQSSSTGSGNTQQRELPV
ncbi:hypothetical protein EC991_001680 [Linnemannia zychae]|nr:hypothetical protein EC991_001680 [Linnemannia zychae]